MARIFTNRKSGFIQRGGAMRRESLWIGVGRTQTTVAASATAALIGVFNAAALALRPFTIVRVRGVWLAHSDQSAASESFQGNLGYAIVSDQASAVGVTAVPTPATDLGSDMFFVHDMWPGLFDLVGSSHLSEIRPREYDSKAMRKVNDDQDLAITIEAGIGDQGCVIDNAARILVKLH